MQKYTWRIRSRSGYTNMLMKTYGNIAKMTKAYNHKQIKLRYNAICIHLYFTPCKQHLRWNIIYHFYSLTFTTTLVFTVYIRTLLMY